MSLRINTNVAALTAHKNMVKNDAGLSASLEKLSSGLRINRAADDASGMAIADSLKSQALGIGQAIKNANDGISIVQTADGALEESINIVNTIKTKAIQAAQDGQTAESRKAIQSDITKLMEELDAIAKTTSFNNKKLLSGNFTNKAFQIGAYSGEIVSISIGSSESTKIGHVNTSEIHIDNGNTGGTVALSLFSNLDGNTYNVAPVDILYNNSAENGMGALADAVNKLSDVLGFSAKAEVISTSSGTVSAGTTGNDFAINGVNIGRVEVADNDSTGTLVKSINVKSNETGVVADVDSQGRLSLTSTDGRAIMVSGYASGVINTTELSTVGYLQINQATSNAPSVSVSGTGIDVTATSINVAGLQVVGPFTGGAATVTKDMLVRAGSSLGSAVIQAGSVFTEAGGLDIQAGMTTNTIATTSGSMLKGGMVNYTSFNSGTIFKAGTIVGDTVTVYNDGDAATKTYTVAAGTTLKNDVHVVGLATTVTAAEGGDWYVAAGSVLKSETVFAGSYIGADVFVSGITLATTDADMVVKAGSILTTGNLINGSTVGADMSISGTVVNKSDMLLKAGSILASGSLLKAGTYLTQDVTGTTNTVGTAAIFKAGTLLTEDLTIAFTGATTHLLLTSDMTVKANSQLTLSKYAANTASGVTLLNSETNRLSDVSVLTQADAQKAISIADAALKDLDKVRSDLGSVQNQLTSTISNLSVTQVNITASESAIRDVDFADEAANFSKMQILAQASSFAMAQANATGQNVLRLLQG